MDIMQKVRRILEDMSQQELADLVGVSQPTINRWRNKGIKRMLAKNQDAVNDVYDRIFGSPDRKEIPLPDTIAMKFYSLPGTKQNTILGVLATIIELAEWRD